MVGALPACRGKPGDRALDAQDVWPDRRSGRASRASAPRRSSCIGLRRPSYRVEHGRYLAEHIAGARLVEVPGTDHFWFTEQPEPILAETERFVAGIAGPPKSDRQCWRRCSSPTSSTRPEAIGRDRRRVVGAICSSGSGESSGASGSSPGVGGRHGGRRLPGDLRRSGPRQCAVRVWRATRSATSGSRFGLGCTPARWRCLAKGLAGVARAHRAAGSRNGGAE